MAATAQQLDDAFPPKDTATSFWQKQVNGCHMAYSCHRYRRTAALCGHAAAHDEHPQLPVHALLASPRLRCLSSRFHSMIRRLSAAQIAPQPLVRCATQVGSLEELVSGQPRASSAAAAATTPDAALATSHAVRLEALRGWLDGTKAGRTVMATPGRPSLWPKTPDTALLRQPSDSVATRRAAERPVTSRPPSGSPRLHTALRATDDSQVKTRRPPAAESGSRPAR